MAKYDPLRDYLIGLSARTREKTLTFEQVERIIGAKLPASACNHRAWWANERHGSHVHARAWLDAGWHVSEVNQGEKWVRFRRE